MAATLDDVTRLLQQLVHLGTTPPGALASRSPAKTPIGGSNVVTTQLTQIAQLHASDGVPRPMTCIVTAAAVSGYLQGVAARVTYSSPRGRIILWTGVPAIVPVVGMDVRIDAILAPLPYKFTSAGPGQFVLPGPTTQKIPTTGYIIEGWADYPPPTCLATQQPPLSAVGSAGPVSPVIGPALVTDIVFKNQSATAVQLIVCDQNNKLVSSSAAQVLASIIVPGNDVRALSADALGGFFQGVSIYGVTSLVAGSPYTLDANAQNVTCDIFGNFLLT